MATTAEQLAALVSSVTGAPLPVGLRAWDGSAVPAGWRAGTGQSGAADAAAATVVVTHRRALRRLLWSPGELGAAEAYLSGDLEVEGDLAGGLSAVWRTQRDGGAERPGVRIRDYPRLLTAAARLGAVGPRPAPPGQGQRTGRARLSGRRHTRSRDRAAIAYHYDLGNEFYEFLLDSSMAYSCAYYAQAPADPAAAAAALPEAQRAKLDLICRKLGLHEGARHLDIGCGWGSLICHAAEHYGTSSTGVTLSKQQHEYVTRRVAAAGLQDRVTVRLSDYRDLALAVDDQGAYDAVSTIEMGEHVGEAEYPEFARILAAMVRPGGRVLVQQMSRGTFGPNTTAGGGAFIETYIAPDMHMKPLATTAGLLAGAGLEVRDVHALREHYTWTAQAWLEVLETQWDEAVSLIGEVGARVWRLYLAGGALAFAENRMGVDQILAVRPGPDGVTDLAPTRAGWDAAS